MWSRISRRRRLACCALVVLAATTAGTVADASRLAHELEPATLARAKAIRAEVNARYRRMPGPKLVVTEATTTAAVESFTLLDAGVGEARIVPAANGIWYAVCPLRASCPYPGRLARPAGDFLVRRLALELAVRTFLQTPAPVVAISLPTADFTFLLVERHELGNLASLAKVLSGNLARAPSVSLLRIVHELTRPRVFVGIELEPTSGGHFTLTGFPYWPEREAGGAAERRTPAGSARVGGRARAHPVRGEGRSHLDRQAPF
jgi:hypothetical protein